jgi:2-dehydro-3-deoxyphosphogluconate aldolase/(4S)-4-hydroxy-2-oxoglutarate aldolase
VKIKKDQVLEKVFELKAVAVVRLDSDKNIVEMTQAMIDGGISAIEITLTTPNALGIIEYLSKEFGSKIVLGAGSVLNRSHAEQAVSAGAQYLVSPISNRSIIDAALECNVASMIGAFTPTEIQSAYEYGADIIKIFPADVLGMQFFKSVLAPMPHLKLMPTGGVSLTNAGEWIKSGACAVGVGSALVNKKAIESGNFDLITTNAKTIMDSINAVI